MTLVRLESSTGSPRLSTVAALEEALRKAGVTIVDNQPYGGFTIVVEGTAAYDAVRRLQDPDAKREATKDRGWKSPTAVGKK